MKNLSYMCDSSSIQKISSIFCVWTSSVETNVEPASVCDPRIVKKCQKWWHIGFGILNAFGIRCVIICTYHKTSLIWLLNQCMQYNMFVCWAVATWSGCIIGTTHITCWLSWRRSTSYFSCSKWLAVSWGTYHQPFARATTRSTRSMCEGVRYLRLPPCCCLLGWCVM